MGFFRKSKKGGAKQAAKPAKTGVSKGKLHTHKRNKTVLGAMKLSPSVPEIIENALHGATSDLLNSPNDAVRSDALTINGAQRYPVLILDESSLEAAGANEKANRQAVGMLSVGLKTSSGNAGFVPVITDQSLNQGFIGILPMHDSLAVLHDIDFIRDYQPGWLVGLVDVDGGALSVTLTELRLSIVQWQAYLEGQVDLAVQGGRVVLSENAPTNSDPLATTSQEEAGGQSPDDDPWAAFDDDEDSHDATSQAVSALSQSATQTLADSTNGFTLDDLAAQAGVDDEPAQPVMPESATPEPTPAPVPQSQVAVPTPQPQATPDPTPQPQPVPQSQPVVEQPQPAPQPVTPVPAQPTAPTSVDEQEAQRIKLEDSVAGLQDLNVSISSHAFEEQYVATLQCPQLPLQDESNDPAGIIHHYNERRRSINAAIAARHAQMQAGLRQWFQSQRAGLLRGLQTNVQTPDENDDGHDLNQYQQRIIELQQQLNLDELQAQAQAEVEAQQAELDRQFAEERQAAEAQMKAELDARFAQKQADLEERKRDLVNSAISKHRAQVERLIQQTKQELRDQAAAIAEGQYADIMAQAANRAQDLQEDLTKNFESMRQGLDNEMKQAYDTDTERIKADAVKAEHDNMVASTNQEMDHMRKQHQAELDEQQRRFKQQMEAFQQQASLNQDGAVARVQGDLDRVRKERDEAQANFRAYQADVDKKLERRDESHRNEVAAIQQKLDQMDASHDREMRRSRMTTMTVAVASIVIGLGGGYVGGQLSGQTKALQQQVANKNANETRTSGQPTQPIIINPGSSNSNSSNSDHNSNSNSESHHVTNADSDSHSSDN